MHFQVLSFQLQSNTTPKIELFWQMVELLKRQLWHVVPMERAMLKTPGPSLVGIQQVG